MFNILQTATVGLIRLALDAASMRHQAIANNIANVNTPGYTPLRVNFEQQFASLQERVNAAEPLPENALAGIQPTLEAETVGLGTGSTAVAIDMEAAKLAQNVVHYQALLKGLNKKFAIVSAAINEGKR